MFSSEWLVSVEPPGSATITTFVNQRNVRIENRPTRTTNVDGWVRVSLVEIDKKSKSVLIDLPQGGLAESTRVRVPEQFVQQRQQWS
jgi:hypothetical protein